MTGKQAFYGGLSAATAGGVILYISGKQDNKHSGKMHVIGFSLILAGLMLAMSSNTYDNKTK